MDKSEILSHLSRVQAEAATAIEGPSLIIAGAGSGKTRVLTYRIAYMLGMGIKPYNIMALTFTNKAAGEMKERIAQVAGASNVRGLWMGTFHSLFSRILRAEAETLGFTSSFTIYDTSDARNMVKTIVKDFNLNEDIYKPKDVASRISSLKNDLITPQAYRSNAVHSAADNESQRTRMGDIYREYMVRCKRNNAMDFDDLLLYANLLFRDHKEVLRKYQEQFTYLLVDEYQDTNFAQYLIIKELSALNRNICVVGDDAQSIYSFRGAKIENILRFNKDYADAKLFKLEQNYRSTRTIVGAANSIISKNSRQIRKESFSEKGDGDPIKLISADTDKQEAFDVVEDMQQQMARNNLAPKDIAVLYRTNSQSRVMEDALRSAGIPYKIYGGLSFYQRAEIKDIMAYVRLIVNPDDDEALRRIINVPSRGIGPSTVDKIVARAAESGTSIW
ncbi:MAG: UvrD-helicase domain-containing protein, partial [Rikenellaceae bacterium]|nr:UvrD-helicase domain-containing protein [Rikenellaceae bacterium]